MQTVHGWEEEEMVQQVLYWEAVVLMIYQVVVEKVTLVLG